MLVKLREWFGGLFRKEKERPFIDLATGNIPDPEEFIEYLEVKSKAKSDALNDLPSPESGQLTGTEAEICQVVVDNTILIVMQEHEHRLHGHQQQIDNFDLGRSITELTEVEQSFKDSVARLELGEEQEISNLRNSADTREKDYETFRSKHVIDREPQNRRSMDAYAAAAGTFLLEGVLNAYFFKVASPLGWLGGTVQALGFAAVDIVVVFNLGQWIRYLNATLPQHQWPKKDRKGHFKGAASALIAISWISAYNFLVAHYREQLIVDPDTAGELAVAAFMESPFGLADIESWLLFCLGALFSIFGMVAGYKSDDPIPGYGERHREMISAQDRRDDHVSRTLDRLKGLWDEATEELQVIRDDAENHIKNTRATIGIKTEMTAHLHRVVRSVERTANTVISVYRDENRTHRQLPAPSYFRVEWEYPFPPNWEYEPENDEVTLRRLEDRSEMVTAKASEVATTIWELYERSRLSISGSSELPEGKD